MTATNLSAGDDPRWTAFNTKGFACSCGERHVGLFPINLHVPIGWTGATEYEPEEAFRMDRDFMSSTLCVWQGKNFAVRTRLFLTMQGADPAAFLFTVWAKLDRPEFESYIAALRNNRLRAGEPMPARLMNRLGGFPDTFNLMGTAFQQTDGGLPVLLIHGIQAGHLSEPDLIRQQHEGIGVDRMLELFAAYGHDMSKGQ